MFKRFTDGNFALGLTIGGLLTIFSLVCVIGLNYCPNQPCQYTGAADNPSNNARQGVWNMPNPARGTFSYNSEPEYTEGNPERHEYYDLRAQERMAHATDWIAWITAVTGFFSILGLGAIVYTLNLHRSANKIMRDEKRPWMQFAPTVAQYERDGVTRVSIGFKPKNIGGRPAKNVRFQIHEGKTPNKIEPAVEIAEALRKAEAIPARAGVVFPNSSPTTKVTTSIVLPKGESTCSQVCTCAVFYDIGESKPACTVFCWILAVRTKNGLPFGEDVPVGGDQVSFVEMASHAT
ncbi:MAG: hypothetical protein ABJF86_10370 [Tateyamaria sp.]|uniref:hypothetical protein n=1 Tax=Tateyamaria sp. TaxID=1929288 RepID=UPI003272C575